MTRASVWQRLAGVTELRAHLDAQDRRQDERHAENKETMGRLEELAEATNGRVTDHDRTLALLIDHEARAQLRGERRLTILQIAASILGGSVVTTVVLKALGG
jgi:hypothetical protein